MWSSGCKRPALASEAHFVGLKFNQLVPLVRKSSRVYREAMGAIDGSSEHAIEVAGLTKHFGSTRALQGVDLVVPHGTVFGLIGPNGAGKTTAMRILLDLMRPTSGSVSVLGTTPKDGGVTLRRRIGYLPGELILEGRTTGSALLAHYAQLSGPVPRNRIESLAERLDLDLSRQVRSLSKGNKQKLGLIQSLMHDPELLILDEPTSGLDPLMQQIFHELMHEARDRGATVFLSSHVLSEVELVASQVAILRQGAILTTSSVTDLRKSATRRVRLELPSDSAEVGITRLGAVPGLTALRSERADPSHSAPRHGARTTRTDDSVAVTGELAGPPGALIAVLADIPILDISIATPNLEDAVLDLYGRTDRSQS